MIDYECENKYKGNISLKEYMNKFNKFSLAKEKCNDWEKNVINLYVIYVSIIIQMEINIILLFFKDMILYVKFIQIYIVFIVLNVNKIYVFIVNLNIHLMI